MKKRDCIWDWKHDWKPAGVLDYEICQVCGATRRKPKEVEPKPEKKGDGQ